MAIALPHLAGQLILALLAGMLLNLTPCVLPAIPVKVRTIMYHSGASGRERALAALAFTAGSLLFFLVLALITAALHWTWGAVFQSRGVVLGLVILLCGFAAVTFFDTRIPVPSFAQNLRGRHHLEAFLSGAFSALLAAPCTGPFLGGVLAFAVTQPGFVIIAIFLCVGLGLALPYIVMLARPQLLNRLPRAGAWSERVRQALAFVLLGAAAFFARELLPGGTEWWLWIGWLVVVTMWMLFVLWRDHTWSARGVAIGFTLLGAIAVSSVGPLAGRHPALAWHPLPESGVPASPGQPLLVEFTADWCINCQVLQRTVYASEPVRAAAHRAGLKAYQADLTHPHRRLEKLLLHYGGAGLPFAVVINAHGQVVKRFAGLFTARNLIDAIHRASRESS